MYVSEFREQSTHLNEPLLAVPPVLKRLEGRVLDHPLAEVFVHDGLQLPDDLLQHAEEHLVVRVAVRDGVGAGRLAHIVVLRMEDGPRGCRQDGSRHIHLQLLIPAAE